MTYLGMTTTKSDLADRTALSVVVDGHLVQPAITTYHGSNGTTIGTPAIDSNLVRDVYVTFDAVGGTGQASGAQVQSDLPAGSVGLAVTSEPLLAWLWLGGLVVGLGSALSFIRRREEA